MFVIQLLSVINFTWLTKSTLSAAEPLMKPRATNWRWWGGLQWLSIHCVSAEASLCWAMCLVASCGSNDNCRSCVVNPWCTFALVELFTCRRVCLALGVLSERTSSIPFTLSVDKSTPGTRCKSRRPSGGGICETWDICILPYFILVSCLIVFNKMTAV